MSRFLIIVGGIVVAAVLIFIPIAFVLFIPQDALRSMSYVAIIFTSIFACALVISVTALVVAVVFLVRVLTSLTDSKVAPLLDKINETADSAKGTISYVGEGVVSPLVKVSAILAGIRAGIVALLRGGRS